MPVQDCARVDLPRMLRWRGRDERLAAGAFERVRLKTVQLLEGDLSRQRFGMHRFPAVISRTRNIVPATTALRNPRRAVEPKGMAA